MYLGSWKIDDLLTFTVNTHVASTGVATDADSPPTYRVYEDETTTPIITGSMALLDSSNTDGHYSEQITLSAANGFEKGKSYSIRIAATVSSVAGATTRNFQIEAEVDANVVSGAVPSVTGAVGSIAAGGLTAASLDATFQTRIGIKGNGTAQSAAADDIVVAAGTGSLYKTGDLIAATGSTQGYAQTRSVAGVSTDTLSVSPDWDVTPSGTITYVVFNGAPASETALPGVNIKQINSVTITGDGSGSPFDV
jgi:hypothetical protein